jgi:hypothetical protein
VIRCRIAVSVAMCLMNVGTASAENISKLRITPGFPVEEPIRTLALRITTSTDLLGGTSNEIWFDIGPRAWKLPGSFPRGETRTIDLDLAAPREVGLVVGDIVLLRLEKKGINGWTNAPDSLFDLAPKYRGDVTPERLRDYYEDVLRLTSSMLDERTPTRKVEKAVGFVTDLMKATGLEKARGKELGDLVKSVEGITDISKRLREEARKEHEEARRKLDDLDALAKMTTKPRGEHPRPGEWKVASVVVLVNGKEYVAATVDRWLKRGAPVWAGPVADLEPEELFIQRLRVDKNGSGGHFAEEVSRFTTVFKNLGISGWDDDVPVKKATVIGILRNAPSAGTDGFVSLDLELESVTTGTKTFVLDGKHETFSGIRFSLGFEPPLTVLVSDVVQSTGRFHDCI